MTFDIALSIILMILFLLGALVFCVLILPKMQGVKFGQRYIPMPKIHCYLRGHAYDFMDVRHHLRALMGWYRELGDVFMIWIMHKPVVVTANARDVAAILSKTEIFARPAAQVALFNDLQSDNFQTMNRELHAAQRKRMRDALSPKLISNHSEIVTRAASGLVSKINDVTLGDVEKPIDFTPLLADTTFRVLLATILGCDVEEEEERQLFAKESRDFLTELFIEVTTYPFRRIFRFFAVRRKLFGKHRAVKRFTGKLVDKRAAETEEERNNRPLDMMDIILELDPNDRERQVGNATMFAIAGFESSSEALAWALYEITGRPEVADKIRSELTEVLGVKKQVSYEDVQKLTYLKWVWNETLRLHPAAGFLIREAKKDTTLPGSGVAISKGVQVGALIAGAQRNKRVFQSPDEFLPERWADNSSAPLNSFLPFSTGPERCPGRPLADYEGVVILAHLFQSFDMGLGCAREDVVGISDWAERAKSRAPGAPEGDLSWSVPIKFKPRQ